MILWEASFVQKSKFEEHPQQRDAYKKHGETYQFPTTAVTNYPKLSVLKYKFILLQLWRSEA